MYDGGIAGCLDYIKLCYSQSLLIWIGLATKFSTTPPNLEKYYRSKYLRKPDRDAYLTDIVDKPPKQAVLESLYEHLLKNTGPMLIGDVFHKSWEAARQIYESRVGIFYNYVFPFIKNNPRVKFIVFIPPYSCAYAWACDIRNPYGRVFCRQFRQIMFEELTRLPNVTLHDCETDVDLATDVNNHVDVCHLSIKGSSNVIKAIAQGRNIVTAQNIACYQRKFDNLSKLRFK
jgi:hypothetical protein